MKRKKSIRFLLCLAAVAAIMSTSFSMSTFADDEDEGYVSVIYAQDENNGYVSLNSDGSIQANKNGYYAVFDVECDYENFTETWSSVGSDEEFDTIPELLSSDSAYAEYKVGDTLPATFEEYGNFYIAFKDSKNSSEEVFIVSEEEFVDEGYTEDELFSFSITEQTASEVKLHFNVETKEDRVLSNIAVYLDDEVYDAPLQLIPEDGSVFEFDYAVHSNGTYKFRLTDNLGYWKESELEVNCIDTSIVTDETETSTAPNITYSLSTNETGLSGEEPLTITISSDIQCSITADGMPAAIGVTSANFDVYENGVYTFYATNEETAETSSVAVTVTNFGDGTLPDYTDPDNIVDPTTQNDNPISDGNHGSYWEDAAANLTDIY